jgi:hypothetical protein
MLQHVLFDHKKYSIFKNQFFPLADETPLAAAAKKSNIYFPNGISPGVV